MFFYQGNASGRSLPGGKDDLTALHVAASHVFGSGKSLNEVHRRGHAPLSGCGLPEVEVPCRLSLLSSASSAVAGTAACPSRFPAGASACQCTKKKLNKNHYFQIMAVCR